MINFNNIHLPFSEENRIIHLVSENGLMLGSLAPEWQENARVVEAAVKQNGLAIVFAPLFHSDREMGLLALKNNGLAYFYLNPQLRQDKILKRIAQQNFPQRLPSSLVKKAEPNREEKRVFFLSPANCKELASLDRELSFLQERGFSNQRIHVRCEKDPENVAFLRDARVCLLNGEQLIPYSPKDFKSWFSSASKCHAVFPYAYKQFLVTEDPAYFGFGFNHSNKRQSVLTSCMLGLPYTLARTIIEGGNCFLFIDRGVKKAIVGEWSLYLSYYALKEQGFFNEEDGFFEVQDPSVESIRLARNLDLYREKKQNCKDYQREGKEISEAYEQELVAIDLRCSREEEIQTEETDPYREYLIEQLKNKYDAAIDALKKKNMARHAVLDEKIIAPVSEKDREVHLEEAKEIHARLENTKAKMAEELQISLEQLIFSPQTDFHLDTKMWVTPDGQVVLHDSVLAERFLKMIQQLPNLSQREREFIQGYLKTARVHAQVFKDLEQEQEIVLRERGLRVHKIPAVFEYPGVSLLNYCNGIFLQKTKGNVSEDVFLTTGPSFEEESTVHESFKKLFCHTFPETKFREVNGMSKLLAESYGGLRCLTFTI